MRKMASLLLGYAPLVPPLSQLEPQNPQDIHLCSLYRNKLTQTLAIQGWILPQEEAGKPSVHATVCQRTAVGQEWLC